MIKNDQQLATSTRKVEELRHASGHAPAAERDSIRRLVADIETEIREYQAVRGGSVTRFELNELDGIGEALIRARIASGKTQRELAEAVGVTQQQVQRDEACAYASASLARVAEVLDALEYRFVGSVHAQSEPALRGETAATRGSGRGLPPPTRRSR